MSQPTEDDRRFVDMMFAVHGKAKEAVEGKAHLQWALVYALMDIACCLRGIAGNSHDLTEMAIALFEQRQQAKANTTLDEVM